MLRLAYFVSHPIQYQAPLLQLIAADPDIDLKVFFYSDFSLQSYQDPGFGRAIKWDTPLLEGYEYEFLDCWSFQPGCGQSRQSIAKNIGKQLEIGQFDAVWVHGWAWFCGLQAVLAANRLGIPVFLRGETSGVQRSGHPAKQKIREIFLNQLFQRITGFLYIGTLNRQFYQSYGITDDQLFPMPYAVANSYFQQQAMAARTQRNQLKQSLNLDPSRPIILYAAKLIEVKRPQDLLVAYRSLSPDGIQEPDPYLLVVGDGNLRSTLEAQVREMGWQSIHFLGFCNQSEMPAMYDLCDVFVLPSRFEPWGLAINEVMNAGKAIVVSDQVGCASDLVIDQENGRIFPAGNIPALAEALVWAIEHAIPAGQKSLKRIQTWSFQEDLAGLKASLYSLGQSSNSPPNYYPSSAHLS
jgi:glycosyltransferase involved in cell wall biosynthesis